jgi:multidrug efflux pump subunit AcrB
MMTWLERLIARRRLILTIAALLSLVGAIAWGSMVRQEDPRLPNYWGQMVIAFPGAEAEMVERLVLEPIEDRLAEVAEIGIIDATAYAEMAVLFIELRNDVNDPESVWDEVREAVDEARQELPEGVGEPGLNDDVSGEQESVVLALTGSSDPLQLLAAGRRLKQELLSLPAVAKVLFIADPVEQVTIELDDAVARRLGLSAEAVASQLSARNSIIPGGSLHLGGKTVRLRPLSELQSLQEIAATQVVLPTGSSVPLAEVAQVRLGEQEPVSARMRFNGEMSIGLGVVARKGNNLVTFGREVRAQVARVAPSLQPIQVQEVTFQPRQVADRLSELGRSLLLGVLIVAGVVILAMGLRLGLVVASVVPLVASAALAIFAMGGGILHQISIAALVLALGMLVDNAIVVAENVQWRLDRGASQRDAATGAVRELAVPLAAATATTVAAFVPMLLAQGPTAEFTRSIPVLIMLTLSVSYLFATLVTPIVSEMALVPGSAPTSRLTAGLARRLAGLAVGRPATVLVMAVMIVGASLVATGWIQKQFFPSSDRNQLTVEVKLPEGTHLDTTDAASRALEKALLEHPQVTRVAAFMGRGTPKFYYNIQRVPWSPHIAQILVETRTNDDVEPLLGWLDEVTRRQLPEAEVIPQRLEQGPPVVAPVEVRLFGKELPALHRAANMVGNELRTIEGTTGVRNDLGPGAPNLRLQVDDAAAARYQISRVQVARALYGHTRGLPVGDLRSGEDPIPVVVRSSRGELLSAEELESLDVASASGRAVPLAQVAHFETTWRPAAINHRNRQRVVSVTSQLVPGYTYSDVLAELEPRLAALDLPAGISLGFGGDAEGSGEANAAMLRTVPIGLVLLLGVLLAEFNSFRRMAIILVTVPLAAAGVVPGLLIGHQPFGFMSMLGVFALVGIVVNNAIVLLEVVESRLREGAGLDQALTDAVERRIRPILLTTATTVAGLLPLALSSSTLWPPLASAMISGLLASTLLTLVVVPAMYRVLFAREAYQPRRSSRLAPVATVLLFILLVGGQALAEEPLRLTLAETMARAQQRPAAHASRAQAQAAEQLAVAERRAALLPVAGASLSISDRSKDLVLATPIGELPFGDSRQRAAAIEVRQPLLAPSQLLFAAPAARSQAEAARSQADRSCQELSVTAAAAHLDLLGIDARLAATNAYVRSLDARLNEVEEMVTAGRALPVDALKLRLAMDQAGQDLFALDRYRGTAEARLAQAVGVTGGVAPLPVPDLGQRQLPEAGPAIATALESRADLTALRSSLRALAQRRSAVRAELLPRLDAHAGWSWSDGSPYTTDSWVEGAVIISWRPFAAGTRGPRIAAIRAEQRAREAELLEAERGAAVEVRAAIAELESVRNAVVVAEQGVEYAVETLRVEQERHLAGRTTVNDLLEAEAQLRERRTTRDLARLAVVGAWVRLWLATGADAYHPFGS